MTDREEKIIVDLLLYAYALIIRIFYLISDLSVSSPSLTSFSSSLSEYFISSLDYLPFLDLFPFTSAFLFCLRLRFARLNLFIFSTSSFTSYWLLSSSSCIYYCIISISLLFSRLLTAETLSDNWGPPALELAEITLSIALPSISIIF